MFEGVDSSAVPSVRARLEELKLQQQSSSPQLRAGAGKPPPPPPLSSLLRAGAGKPPPPPPTLPQDNPSRPSQPRPPPPPPPQQCPPPLPLRKAAPLFPKRPLEHATAKSTSAADRLSKTALPSLNGTSAFTPSLPPRRSSSCSTTSNSDNGYTRRVLPPPFIGIESQSLSSLSKCKDPLNNAQTKIRPVPALPPRSKYSTLEYNPPPPSFSSSEYEPPPAPIPRRLPPVIPSPNFNPIPKTPPPVPTNSRPPPVPVATRPTISFTGVGRPAVTCLRHRDFRAADAHAACSSLYPQNYQSIPPLAEALCKPFSSHTDKARVIFTYLHHHIAYDAAGFFGLRPKGSQDAFSVLQTGLAVCQGYADLFVALATPSGLEARLISGHGKGFGHITGSSIPYPPSGHAWNAVRIDDGEWWLIDPCWGAGHINSETQTYVKAFSPIHFVNSPAEFAKAHYPASGHAGLPPAVACPISWGEYCGSFEGRHGVDEADRPMIYGRFATDMGLLDRGAEYQDILPAKRRLSTGRRETFLVTQGPCTCPGVTVPKMRWLLFLKVGESSEKQDLHLMKRVGERKWAVDVDLRLDVRKVELCFATKWKGEDAEGLNPQEWESGLGKVGWSWGSLVLWGED